jgi:hypothetical protein
MSYDKTIYENRKWKLWESEQSLKESQMDKTKHC